MLVVVELVDLAAVRQLDVHAPPLTPAADALIG